jgi:DNA-binding beta-propeller fold protein YncE
VPENFSTCASGGRGGTPAVPRPQDAHVLKFSRTGQFLLQIGKAGQLGDKNSETALDHPVDVAVDAAANEVYVADGGASQRIVVFDATTGAHKRHWGGHGTDFGRVSSVALSKDGQVYVGDRRNDRIQVFKKDGTFVKEASVSKATLLAGSVWDVAFSSDAAQRYAFVADGQDAKIFVLDRATLGAVSSFGDGGGWPGTFRMVGSVGVDSKGNLYTGETFEGKRVQKFLKK